MHVGYAKSLPYLLHTNRELGLMLAGKKPLAEFADGSGRFPEVVLRYLRLFDRHVAAGRLVRRDHFHPPENERNYVVHRILFALPEEEWRISAMIDLKSSVDWSPDHERREGELLGYEDWMNDHFVGLIGPKEPPC